MTRVSLIPCADYARDVVGRAVHEALAPLGGMEAFVRPGMRVLVKVNLLMRRAPERATTTHPEVVRAVCEEVMQAGGTAIVADSPGGPFTRGALRGVYETCGMRALQEAGVCELNDDFSSASCAFPQGHIARSLDVIACALHADAIIDVGKLKTHGLTGMTACAKNLFGLVPGTVKAEYHARYPDIDDFSTMLCDLCAFVRPALCVLDAVDAMEGEGPSGGRPRRVGAILAGVDPHAVDAVAARLIGLDEERVTTLRAARRLGLLDAPQVLGARVEDLCVRGFDLPGTSSALSGRWLLTHMPGFLRPRPVFTHAACDGCGTCLRACPAHAISMDGANRPRVDMRKCIRCFCCQELCPKTDVRIHRNPVFRYLR